MVRVTLQPPNGLGVASECHHRSSREADVPSSERTRERSELHTPKYGYSKLFKSL